MTHSEYRRIVPKSKTAVLFIHGILGTPNQFKKYISLLPQDWSVVNVLLVGHGGEMSDFSNSTMEDWKNQVELEMKDISSKYENVLVVGHSMGALFAINLAVSGKYNIKGIFLLSPPINITLKPSIVISCVKFVYGQYTNEDVLTLATKDACSVEVSRKLTDYFKWIPNYLSLFKEIRNTRKLIPLIDVKCCLQMAKKDELILKSSSKPFEKNKCVDIIWLDNSRHNYYDRKDYRYLLRKFDLFCKSFDLE